MKSDSLSPQARTLLWQRTVSREIKRLAKENASALDRLNRLNGSVEAWIESKEALLLLAETAPKLVRLAEQLNPELVKEITDLARQQQHSDIFWTEIRRRLNPVRPLGALCWLLFASLVSAVIFNIVAAVGPILHSGSH